MKKLLRIAVLGLMFGGNAFSEIKVLDQEFIKSKDAGTYVSIICINQYEYVLLSERHFDTVDPDASVLSNSIVQSFEIVNGKSLPKKCK